MLQVKSPSRSCTDLNSELSPLFDIVNGPVAWEIFKCALEVRLFDELTAPITAQEVAIRRGLDPHICGEVLEALVHLGFVEKAGGRFVVLEKFRRYLGHDSERSLNDVIGLLARRSHRGLASLRAALTGEAGSVESSDFSWKRAEWTDICTEIEAYQKSLSAKWALGIISELPGFDAADSLLDLSSGPGYCGMEFARANPGLHVTLFDLPGSIAFAKEAVDREGFSSRTTFIAGDYNTDSLGEGYDFIWASLCFYFAKPDLSHLLRKLHSALRPGGTLVSFHEGLDPAVPFEQQAIRRFMSSLWDRQKLFERGQIASSMQETGFGDVLTRQAETAVGPIEITTGRR